MAQFNLNEAEAFRRIQKASMDTRKPMRAIAEAILLTSQVSVNPNERERRDHLNRPASPPGAGCPCGRTGQVAQCPAC